jgi:hypothetical protein
MNIEINENGCKDPEVRLLDTKLPYFYAQIKDYFFGDLEHFHLVIEILDSKDKFKTLKGEECQDCSFVKENIIYIYEPSLLEEHSKCSRKDFYKILCQELLFLFYKKSKGLF